METTIHSQTMMEWPADRKAAMQAAAEAREKAKGVDHFPIKSKEDMMRHVNQRTIPGAPAGPSGHMPMAQPMDMTPPPAAPQAAPVEQPSGIPPMPPRPQAHQAHHAPHAQAAVSANAPMSQDDVEMFQQFLQQGARDGVAQGPVPQDLARAPFETTPVAQAVSQVTDAQHLYVGNEMPGFTNPTADSEYTSVALPSRFAYYGFKDLYVKPFIIEHIGKLQRAHNEKSLLPIVEAMSTVIYTTDERYRGVPLAFELSLPDFFFVLYWLRLNSFTKSNYVHTTVCQDDMHVARVELGRQLPQLAQKVLTGELKQDEFEKLKAQALDAETLKISEVIRRTEMKINELERVPDPALYAMSDDRLMVRPPIMRDVIEMAEDPRMRDPKTRPDFQFYSRLASHFQHRTMYLTLGQRVDIIQKGKLDDMEILTQFERAIDGYGVEEKIKVQCKCCGATRDSKLVIAAHSFFL